MGRRYLTCRMKKLLLLFCTLLLAIAVITGCGQTNSSNAKPTSSQTTQIAVEESGTYTDKDHDLTAPFRRKIALDIGNEKNQDTQQYGNLNDIVNEKLKAATDRSIDIEANTCQYAANQFIEPFHTQDLILDEIPNHLQHLRSPEAPSSSHRSRPINSLYAVRTSQFRE